jgi:glycosyltransferase involved in cell wall biosynthesis
MRLLTVTSSYPKFSGDVTAPFIESITRGLAARGHKLDVVLPEHPQLQRPDEPGVRFWPYQYAPSPRWALWGYAQSLEADVRLRPSAYALAPLVAFALRRAVGDRVLHTRYDAALLHWVVPNAVAVYDLLRRQRVPFVICLHGSDVFVAERNSLVRPAARRALSLAGGVTACSADLLRRARGLGASEQRSRTIPYGVDVEAFAPRASDESLRQRFGVPAGALMVVAAGRLVEKKGFAYLVEAAACVSGIHVVIAGDGDLRGDLEARAREHRAPVTLAGNLDRSAVAAVLGAADIVAVPSVVDRAGNVDGLPNVLLEALAAGRPVIATRVAGIPDVVRHGENGLLVAPQDAADLAAALRALAADATTRSRLGAAARRTATDELSWEAHVAALEECLVQASTLEAR